MNEVEVTVIGAGAVGLAIAAELAADHQVYVLERNETFGRETSSRSSEVIHAGIYYEPGSLKARLCLEGNRRLYEICARYGVPHQRTGKLIVATEPGELPQLEELLQNGRDNGVELRLLSAREVRDREPEVKALAAVWSPSTGIFDSHEYLRTCRGRAVEGGAHFVYRAELAALEKAGGNFRLTINDPSGRTTFHSRVVINAAGLESARVAAMAGIDLDAAGYRLHYCKGEYFGAGRRLTKGLVYPVSKPSDGGLGIHVTVDTGGRTRFGPNASYVQTVDYKVDETLKTDFWNSARAFLPALALSDLEPDFAGIRPKLQGPGEGFRDFIIRHEADHGLEGLVNLIGIESPGLTASAAIASHVGTIVNEIGPATTRRERK